MIKLIAFLSSCIVLWLRLLSPGGMRAIAAENIVLRQQLIILARGQKRIPRLTFFDKVTLGIVTSMQISDAFGIKLDKNIVRRVLSKYSKNNPQYTGPSWLTFIGHMKDSLWSKD